MKKIHIHGDDVISKIDRNIYGHFAEHIGGVYYDGIWVGEDSKVPNVNGLRLEIIEKMKKINAPVVTLAGRMLCRNLRLERRHRTERKPSHKNQLVAQRRRKIRAEYRRYARIRGVLPSLRS